MEKALRGARAVVVAGQLGPHLLQAAAAAKVEHLVLPSLAGTANSAVAKLLKPSADAGCRDPAIRVRPRRQRWPHVTMRHVLVATWCGIAPQRPVTRE